MPATDAMRPIAEELVLRCMGESPNHWSTWAPMYPKQGGAELASGRHSLHCLLMPKISCLQAISHGRPISPSAPGRTRTCDPRLGSRRSTPACDRPGRALLLPDGLYPSVSGSWAGTLGFRSMAGSGRRGSNPYRELGSFQPVPLIVRNPASRPNLGDGGGLGGSPRERVRVDRGVDRFAGVHLSPHPIPGLVVH